MRGAIVIIITIIIIITITTIEVSPRAWLPYRVCCEAIRGVRSLNQVWMMPPCCDDAPLL